MKKIVAMLISAAILLTLFCACKKEGSDTTTKAAQTDANGFYVDDSSIKLDIGDEIE